jgi:SAM-dependent methyltransferase
MTRHGQIECAGSREAVSSGDRLNSAYLAYRRWCAVALLNHATDRGLLRHFAEPTDVEAVGLATRVPEERMWELRAITEVFVGMGALVRAADGRLMIGLKSIVAPSVAEFRDVLGDLPVPDLHPVAGPLDDMTRHDARPAAEPRGAAALSLLEAPFYRYSRDLAVARVSASTGPLLDLGGGRGLGARRWLEGRPGGHAVVCDIDQAELGRGIGKQGIRRVRADLRRPLPFRANSFTAVIAVGALHFADDLRGCLSEICRVLRRDGLLCIGHHLFRSGTPDFPLAELTMRRAGAVVPGTDDELSKIGAESGLEYFERVGSVGAFGTFLFSRKAEDCAYNRRP